MSYHIPAEETLDWPSLQKLQREKLVTMLNPLRTSNEFYRAKLAALPPNPSLEVLPFTTRAEIQNDQIAHPPYGSNLTYPLKEYSRLHQTSGTAGQPIRWLDRPKDWTWWQKCWGMIYAAANVRPDDRFLFAFSFGPFVGFWAAFESAVASGHLCLAGGGMSTNARIRFLLDNEVTILACTPTYAIHMAESARQEGIDLVNSRIRALFVAGEPGGSIPSVRARIESAFGARLFDHAGMTEIGPYAFECEESSGGLHIAENEFIAEILDPRTGAVCPSGGDGELVLTNLGRLGSPLIRYRTGDLVRLSRNRCACGRSFARLEGGLLGRSDDMLIIRGNNVHPSAVEAILREFAAVAEFRLVVAERGGMSDLQIEIEPTPGAGTDDLVPRVTQAVRDRLNFQPRVILTPPGSLPRFDMKARRVIRQS